MKTELENVLPQEIEKRSFEIITEELGEVSLCLLYTSFRGLADSL